MACDVGIIETFDRVIVCVDEQRTSFSSYMCINGTAKCYSFDINSGIGEVLVKVRSGDVIVVFLPKHRSLVYRVPERPDPHAESTERLLLVAFGIFGGVIPILTQQFLLWLRQRKLRIARWRAQSLATIENYFADKSDSMSTPIESADAESAEEFEIFSKAKDDLSLVASDLKFERIDRSVAREKAKNLISDAYRELGFWRTALRSWSRPFR